MAGRFQSQGLWKGPLITHHPGAPGTNVCFLWVSPRRRGLRRHRQGDPDGESGQDLGSTQGSSPTTTPAQPPVLEEALEGPADPIALGRREEVLQLLAESPPLHPDAGGQDLCYPLQGGERRGRVGGIQGIGVCWGHRQERCG